jgi:uncharacterized membrane protein YqjE
MVNGQPKATIGELVAGMAQDVSSLVRNEIELAKAEVAESAKRGAAGAGLIAAFIGLLLMTWLLLTFAVVYALYENTSLPLWASFLIVAVFYLIVAIIVLLVARAQFNKVKGPEQAIEAQNQTKQIVSRLKPGTTAPTAPTATTTATTAPVSAVASEPITPRADH